MPLWPGIRLAVFRVIYVLAFCAMASNAQKRLASMVRVAHKQREGGGFVVRRPFPSGSSAHVGGTFLMLDHMGPSTYGPGEAIGAPDHPHRGFETVTYVLQGSMQHKDSAGNRGDLTTGMVQWMTAGSGVVHSEMPSDEMLKKGGTLEGFQLWVNLPKKDKMVPPRYQDTPAEAMPLVPVPGAKHAESAVKVVAGEYNGTKAVIQTRTPIGFLDVRLGPGDATEQPVPDGHAGFAYVYRGKALLGSNANAATEGGWVTIQGDSGSFPISCPADATEVTKVLLIYGQPISEPIARYGPFVMNTEEELYQAFEDFQNGKLGSIDGAEERRKATDEARKAQKSSGTWDKEL